MKKKSRIPLIIYLIIALIFIIAGIIWGRTVGHIDAETGENIGLIGTWWGLLPPIMAIGLALITKEVYVSLFFGCAVGALYLSLGNPVVATVDLFGTMIDKLSGNMGIVIFLVVLGIICLLYTSRSRSTCAGY